MSKTILTKLKRATAACITEEEVRIAWLTVLSRALSITFEAERGRNDAAYNQVIIEFKNKGLFKGSTTSRSYKEAVDDRLKKYILKKASDQGLDPSDYIGIATDGDHVVFAHIRGADIVPGHLMPLTDKAVEHVVRALRDSCRRAVTAENLVTDFGHESDIGQSVMQALADALATSLKAKRPNKIRMLFEEWRHLYGQAADLSANQVSSILASVGFAVAVPQALRIPATLFVIHTYDSLVIKLLGAEIVAAHTNQTAYRGFSEAAMVLDDAKLRARLGSDIERGEFFSRAGISGFVEEAIFGWYLDACALSAKAEARMCDALRQLLSGVALYRTDVLTVARSRDVLKHFYQDLVPETLRKSLGEFYTPDWLVDVTIGKLNVGDWLALRFLDPTCGSASFPLAIIRRIRAAASEAGWSAEKTIAHVVTHVWGFDLNPLAVQAARVNLLIAISDLLAQAPGVQLELPVLLADAVYSPARNPSSDEAVVDYVVGSTVANLSR